MTMDVEALGHAIKRAQHRNHWTAERALREVGVTLVQWDALRAIERMPQASGHDLAVATFQSDQAFGSLANRLADRNFISRTAGRRRRIEHALTDAGRSVLLAGDRVTTAVLGEVFAPLAESERTMLLTLLTKLLQDERTAVHPVDSDPATKGDGDS